MIIYVERDTEGNICGGYSDPPTHIPLEAKDTCDPEFVAWWEAMPDMFRPSEWVCVPTEPVEEE